MAAGEVRVTVIVTGEEMRLPPERFVDLVAERLEAVKVKIYEAKEAANG